MSLIERAGLAALRRLDPEAAHGLALRALGLGLGPRGGPVNTPRLATRIAGLALPNPVNLWVDENGTIFVNDPLVARVHLFTSTGAAISGFGEQGNNPGYLGRPRGMATDSDGYIHVVDGLFHRVQIFNREGQLLVWYGDPGGGRSGLALPSDIFIDQDDVIYIADTKNRRIQMFQYITYPDEKK